jgi:hypothetical protein
LESVWPVPASVLVKKTDMNENPMVYLAAGRSGHLDKGISIYGLDLITGQITFQKNLAMPHPTGTEKTDKSRAHSMPGVFNDILVSADSTIHMRHTVFNNKLEPVKTESPTVVKTTSGMLDEEWYFRSHWTLGPVRGQLVVFDKDHAFSVRSGYEIQDRLLNPVHQHFSGYKAQDFPTGALLFAVKNTKSPVEGKPSPDWSFPSRGGKPIMYKWSLSTMLQIRAMLLSGSSNESNGTIWLAGWSDTHDPDEALAAANGQKGGILVARSSKTGKKLASYTLQAQPVWDGLSAANGRIYISLKNGKLICMGQK